MLVGLAGFACGQFSQLTATGDGQEVYFTSQLVLRGPASSPMPTESRLFHWNSNGISLYAERGALAASPIAVIEPGITSPQVSSDGSQIAFTFHNICTAAPGCVPSDSEGFLRGQVNMDLGPGTVQLSRNGRWALLAPPVDFRPETSVLLDLTNGQRTTVPHPSEFVGHSIASDGSVLVVGQEDGGAETGAFSLWKQGQMTPISTAGWPLDLSDDASTIICGAAPTSLSTALTAVDVGTGRWTPVFVAAGDSTSAVYMSMSTDGRLVLYRVSKDTTSGGRAYTADTRTGRSQPIVLPDGEAVTDGTLNGAGTVAFLVTTLGRMLMVTLSSGKVQEMIPSTPWVPYPEFVPGSLSHFKGAFYGSAADWKGRLLMNNLSPPILDLRPGELVVQVPWELAQTNLIPFLIEPPGATPFHQLQEVSVKQVFPNFEVPAPGQSSIFPIIMIRADWSELLQSQPGPGDIVHLYMTGLGPVADPVQTGAAAPLSAPNPILGTLRCRFDPQADYADTVFAGLAPGTVGIYQVSLRMPADAGAAPILDAICQVVYKGNNTTVIFGFGQP
jgi:uncharacterized protein (TIGR03437 family)